MQEKPNLRLSLNKIQNSPIKKTYDYYKTIGNIWNSKYHSSTKIAKYYLNPQELFLTGPLCPQTLSLLESTERERIYHDKVVQNKLISRQRLNERKKERETVIK